MTGSLRHIRYNISSPCHAIDAGCCFFHTLLKCHWGLFLGLFFPRIKFPLGSSLLLSVERLVLHWRNVSPLFVSVPYFFRRSTSGSSRSHILLWSSRDAPKLFVRKCDEHTYTLTVEGEMFYTRLALYCASHKVRFFALFSIFSPPVAEGERGLLFLFLPKSSFSCGWYTYMYVDKKISFPYYTYTALPLICSLSIKAFAHSIIHCCV